MCVCVCLCVCVCVYTSPREHWVLNRAPAYTSHVLSHNFLFFGRNPIYWIIPQEYATAWVCKCWLWGFFVTVWINTTYWHVLHSLCTPTPRLCSIIQLFVSCGLLQNPHFKSTGVNCLLEVKKSAICENQGRIWVPLGLLPWPCLQNKMRSKG